MIGTLVAVLAGGILLAMGAFAVIDVVVTRAGIDNDKGEEIDA